jgi:hypothetical protein
MLARCCGRFAAQILSFRLEWANSGDLLRCPVRVNYGGRALSAALPMFIELRKGSVYRAIQRRQSGGSFWPSFGLCHSLVILGQLVIVVGKPRSMRPVSALCSSPALHPGVSRYSAASVPDPPSLLSVINVRIVRGRSPPPVPLREKVYDVARTILPGKPGIKRFDLLTGDA